jgi:hypothetical protein
MSSTSGILRIHASTSDPDCNLDSGEWMEANVGLVYFRADSTAGFGLTCALVGRRR